MPQVNPGPSSNAATNWSNARIVQLTDAQVAAPTPDILANQNIVYQAQSGALLKASGNALVPIFTATQAAALNPYLGCVATRCYVPTNTTGNVTAQGRTLSYAKDNLSVVQILLANWSMLTNLEDGPGATATFTASIEYPAGVIAGQFKFSGAAAGVVANGGNLLSDPLSLNTIIPRGAAFWIRRWGSCASGHCYVASMGGTGIDLSNFGASLPDLTMTPATNPVAATVNIFAPMAILAYTTNASVLFVGDSIAHGVGDTYTSGPCDQGILARSVGQWAGYISRGNPGQTAASFITTHDKAVALAQYCSHVVCEFGTQDLAGGAATLLTNLGLIAGYYAGKPFFQTTIIPRTTSTDGWITTANQTVTANEAVRLVINGHIKNGNIAGLTGYFDTQRAIESSYESGFWGFIPGTIAPATAAWTADGTHPNRTGYMRVQALDCIQATAFVRA